MSLSDRIAGVVLCGGRSRRMGTPKEWLDVGGEPMLARVVRIVGTVFEPLVVAARPEQVLPPLPAAVEIVLDGFDDAGPLAGIEAALSSLDGRSDGAFITGCDHPFLAPAFIRHLVGSLGDAAGVVLVDRGRIRPLPGVYRMSTLPLLRSLLGQGERRVHAFAERCGARQVDVADLRSVDSGLDSLQNLNDSGQFEDTRRRMGGDPKL